MGKVRWSAARALLAGVVAAGLAGCADDMTGPVRAADGPLLNTGSGVKFYAWTDKAQFIGNSHGIPLMFHAPYSGPPLVFDTRLDRQYVHVAKTCDRPGGWTPRNAWYDTTLIPFASANNSKSIVYVVGDEPDIAVRHEGTVLCPALTPSQYAAVFKDIRDYFHQYIDGSARFEPAGLGFSGQDLSGFDYAQQFYDAYISLSAGTPPPVAAWRFNMFAGSPGSADVGAWESLVTQANNWAAAHGGPLVVGSFGIPTYDDHPGTAAVMPRMFNHIRSLGNTIAAVWWRYDEIPGMADGKNPMVFTDNKLTCPGMKFVELTQGRTISCTRVDYVPHIANQGWDWDWDNWTYRYTSDGVMAGTTGLARDMQAIKIKPGAALRALGVGVCYEVYVRGSGAWQGERCNDAEAGTTGQSLPMLGLKVRLQNPRPGMRVCYRVHVGYVGDMAPVCDNQQAGTLYDDGASYYQDIQAVWIWVEGA